MQNEEEQFSLADATENALLMHRDAHFGGSFDVMIDYYEKEGKGASPEFTINRLKELQQLEKRLNQNLAALLLSGSEAERIAKSKAIYKRLRALYTSKKKDLTTKHARLIADLILSEEEDPEEEIASIVAEKGTIVPALLELIKEEDFYDPLFPGYGQAPALAIRCLGLIGDGDKRAITALFELIGEHDFLDEDFAITALKQMGEPAKSFLLKILKSKPITYDNERAAVALLQFKEDPEVVKSCFQLLQEIDLKKEMLLATHLILICEGLKDQNERQKLLKIGENPSTPSMLRQDIKTISKNWI